MKHTTTEAQLREWSEAGVKHREIAEKMACNISTVSAAMMILGIKQNRKTRPQDLIQSALAGFEVGQTIDEAAIKAGVTRQCVYRHLKSQNHPTTVAEYHKRKAAK